ncbi:Secondary metabolism regulator laeA [Beauveria bassiana]|nr:Secondary metabolism regulator laeA [Beauveria bassiana]KAH8717377.1 Secondary metabolism regulator laeA [Beauveria bassiana]
MAATTTERGYHNTSSSYVLPNDAIEQDRLDAQADAIVAMMGGDPFLAYNRHFTSASKAVDIGCGTGVATIQLAALLPSAKVVGVDITPVPAPAISAASPRLQWETGNILDVDIEKQTDSLSRSALAPTSVGYFFGRMLFLGINDWRKYFQVASLALEDQGIIEHQDLDWKFYRVGTDECLSDDWKWHALLMTAVKKAGLSDASGSNAASFMEMAGLKGITAQKFEFSFVPSAKTPNSQAMGRYVQAKLMPNYPELMRKLLGLLNITNDEMEQLINDALRDLSSEEGIHQKYTVTIARKSIS